jgi:hypothetical protein
MARSDEGFGLQVLKLICVCFCLFSFFQLLQSFRSAHSHNLLGQSVAVLNLIMYATLFCGIHWKKRLAWQLGWFAFGIFWVEWLVFGLASSLRQPKGWIASIIIVVAGFLVPAYWGSWWNRQRNYFVPPPSQI